MPTGSENGEEGGWVDGVVGLLEIDEEHVGVAFAVPRLSDGLEEGEDVELAAVVGEEVDMRVADDVVFECPDAGCEDALEERGDDVLPMVMNR